MRSFCLGTERQASNTSVVGHRLKVASALFRLTLLVCLLAPAVNIPAALAVEAANCTYTSNVDDPASGVTLTCTGGGGGGGGGTAPGPPIDWPSWHDTGGSYTHYDGGGSGGGSGGRTSDQGGANGRSADSGESPCVGNPIIISTGNKIEPELDFPSISEMGLYLKRTYNWNNNGYGLFGKHWLSNFDYKLTFGSSSVDDYYPRPGAPKWRQIPSNTTVIWAHRPDGRRIKYIKNASNGIFYEDKPGPVSRIVNNGTGMLVLYGEDNSVEVYSSYGYVFQVKNEQGIGWSYTYSESRPTKITHSSGRAIQLTWSGNLLTGVTDPAGSSYSFGYSPSYFGTGKPLLLSSNSAWPNNNNDNKRTQTKYHYEDTRFPGALTGKTIAGVRYSRFTYDASGYAASSEHTSSLSQTGVEKYSFAYTPGTGGLLTVVETNPLGKLTTYKFVDGKTTSVTGHASTHCVAANQSVTYDANGYPTLETDFEGHQTKKEFNAKGQLLKVTRGYGSPVARVTQYTWDSVRNRVAAIELVGYRKTAYTFTSNNRIASETITDLTGLANGQSRKTTYTYTVYSDSKTLKSVKVDGPLSGTGDSITSNYAKTGELLSVVNGLGHAQTFSGYNALGLPGSVTGANGAVSTFTYDGNGRMLSRSDKVGSKTALTSWLYDDRGLLQAVTLPDGVTRYYHYDNHRRLVAEFEVEPGNTYAYKTYQYDAASNVVKTEHYRLAGVPQDPYPYPLPPPSQPPCELTLRYCQDSESEAQMPRVDPQPAEAAAAAQAATDADVNALFQADLAEQLNYADLGEASALYIEGESSDAPQVYDNTGTTVEPTDFSDFSLEDSISPGDDIAMSGDESMLEADAVAGTSGTLYYSATVVYDELSRPIARKGNHGQNVITSYDNNGNVETVKDSLGKITTLTYDALDRVILSRDANNGLTSFAYNAGDQLVKVIDPRNRVTTYVYDGFGQLRSQTSPDTGTITFAYGTTGLRIGMTRADGALTEYTYDALGRMKSLITSSGEHTYTYDSCTNGKGLPCVLTTPSGSTSYAYTPQGGITSQTEVIGSASPHTQNFAYDALGRTTGITYTGGVSVGYGYIGSRLANMTVNIDGVSKTLVRDLVYSPFGPVTGWNYGNGLARRYNYDTDGRTTGISVKSASTVLQSLTYAFNANDQITAVTDAFNSHNSNNYTYDALGRLTRFIPGQGDTTEYGYDANGNRTSVKFGGDTSNPRTDTYSISATSNRLNAITGSQNAGYDYDVNGNVINADGVSYLYDGFNRMKSATKAGIKTSYWTNALGLRTYKTQGAPNATQYVHGPDRQLVMEYTAVNGALRTHYLRMGGELVAMVRGGQVYYAHNDHLGRTEMLTNSAKARVWYANNYAFMRGAVSDQVGGFNLGFPGQYWDVETGTWYNGYRNYDQKTGRYLQSDPIGLAGGLNTYAYVGGNPISYVDPLGLWRWPDYVQFQIDLYVFSASASYTRHGDVFAGGGFNRAYPRPFSAGVTIADGWVNPKGAQNSSCPPGEQSADGGPTRDQVNNFLNGYSGGAGVYIFGGGSVSANAAGTAVNAGVGFGGFSVNPGSVNTYRGNIFGDPWP